ncbi:serine/threonine kinase [Aureococcus anophagefferens]|nr:serine/threonine kinase [Aureococcus anophagefferens]
MGASKFHAWMLERFDFATETRGETLFADHVVLDMTKICQSAARRCKNPRDAVKRVLGRVESLFAAPRVASAHSVVRARRTVAALLEGPAPAAKLASARLRRLKSKDGARADGVVAPGAGGDARPRGYDVLEVAPGTEFSAKLSRELGAWAEKRCKRNHYGDTQAQGFRAVFVSDAAVPGDGELKCLEYVAAPRGRGAGGRRRHGGDADMVVMALCRACDGDDTFGPGLRSLVVMNDVGRVYDAGELVGADGVAEGAVVGASSRWTSRAWRSYAEGLRPLYDEASGRVDGAVLASLLEDRHDAETIELKRRRVVEDARSHARTARGGPSAPRAVEVTLVRRADRVAVRVLTPKDFGAVASGAETLTYRVQWRRAGGAGWRDAVAADARRPLVGVPGDAVASRVEIFVDAGSGPLEEDDGSSSASTEPDADGAAWDEAEWLASLEWCLGAYVRGHVRDSSVRYARPAAPPPEAVIAHAARGGVSEPGGARDEPWVPPLKPLEALACLLPGKQCARLLPPNLRPVFDDGSGAEDAWFGAAPALDFAKVAAALETLRDDETDVPFASPLLIRADGRGHPSNRAYTWDPRAGYYAYPPEGYEGYDPAYAAAYAAAYAQAYARAPPPPGSPGAAAPPHELPEPITLGPIYRDGAPMAFPAPYAGPRRARARRRRGPPRARAPAAKGACEPADRPRCRFFASPAGCRRGADCWYAHGDPPPG